MFSILLIALSLSADAFAISVANSLTLRDFRFRHALWMGFYFGLFQFAMPLLGFALGSSVSACVSRWGPCLSFALLAIVGGRMVCDGFCGGNQQGLSVLTHRTLLVLALAGSIDAFAVGVSFAFWQTALLPSCLVIGCTTFILSVAGAMLGRSVPGFSGNRAAILGGLVLICIGVRMLF